jgi:hypothetical protein
VDESVQVAKLVCLLRLAEPSCTGQRKAENDEAYHCFCLIVFDVDDISLASNGIAVLYAVTVAIADEHKNETDPEHPILQFCEPFV